MEIEKADEDFAEKFATGAVSKPWQEEVNITLISVQVCVHTCLQSYLLSSFLFLSSFSYTDDRD